MAGNLHQPLPAPALGVKKWHVPAPEEGTPVAQLQAPVRSWAKGSSTAKQSLPNVDAEILITNVNFQMLTTEINRLNKSSGHKQNWVTLSLGNDSAEKEFKPRMKNVKSLPQGRWGHASSLTWVGARSRQAY